MRVRRTVGSALLLLSGVSLVQTGREVWQGVGSPWEETPITDKAFTFAGHSVVIARPSDSLVPSSSTVVPQERILIDGIAVGAATSARMTTWPYQINRRSPHWVDVVKFVDRRTADSSLWIARRLQIADTVPPRFEIITLDASGHTTVEIYAQRALRDDDRLGTVTALVAEDPRAEFPLSVVNFVWFPYLCLVFPIGTSVLGVVLLKSSKSARTSA